jgi:hypothetical protein
MCRRPCSAFFTVLKGPNSSAGLDLAERRNEVTLESRYCQSTNTGDAQSSTQPEATTPVFTNSVAELVTKQMYERFLLKFPPVDTGVVDVQKWILMWFALDDTFMNDIAVPKYVAHLIISGYRLRTLSDVAILQYLAIQNVSLCAGSGGQLYPKYVIEKLAADIGEARRRAIPEKGKLKLVAELNSERNKRRKLMHASIGQENGDKTTDAEALDGGNRNENEMDAQSSKPQLSTEDIASTTMNTSTDITDDKLATHLTGLEVSEGFEFRLSSSMTMNSSSSKGKDEEKATEEKSAVETSCDEDDEDLLVQKMENFKRISSAPNSSETGES